MGATSDVTASGFKPHGFHREPNCDFRPEMDSPSERPAHRVPPVGFPRRGRSGSVSQFATGFPGAFAPGTSQQLTHPRLAVSASRKMLAFHR